MWTTVGEVRQAQGLGEPVALVLRGIAEAERIVTTAMPMVTKLRTLVEGL